MTERTMARSEYETAPLEIERKFLVDASSLDGGLVRPLDQYPHKEIRQGYLVVTKTGAELRVRHVGDDYILTAKSGGTLLREEVTIPISRATFDELWARTDEPDAWRIQKVRFLVPYGDCTIELDVYEGDLEGLVVAEVEFPDIASARRFHPPHWMSVEVTEDTRYKNQSLATRGVPNDGC